MYIYIYIYKGTWDNTVGIVTCYRLHNLEFKPQWVLDFQPPCRPALWPTKHPAQSVLADFPGGKVAGL